MMLFTLGHIEDNLSDVNSDLLVTDESSNDSSISEYLSDSLEDYHEGQDILLPVTDLSMSRPPSLGKIVWCKKDMKKTVTR